MNTYDMIIVGAGVSGLSMAHYCVKQGLKTLLLEQTDRMGGALHSHRVGGDSGDFWIELGAHSCFNSYGNLLGILEDCRLLDQVIKKQTTAFKLLVGGQLKSIPGQLNYLELLTSLPRLFTRKKAGQSVASYYSAIAGRGNYRQIFGPAFNAVICQPADDFPADLLFRVKPRRKEVIRSFTLPGGLQTIADTMASRPGLTCLPGQEARAVSREGDVFLLVTAAGQQYAGEYLTLATPVSSASPLLADLLPEVAGLLAKIQTAKVESLGVIVPKTALRLPPLAGVIAVDDDFFSAVSRDTVQHPNYRGFTFHFKPGRCADEAKLDTICRVLGVHPQELAAVYQKDNYLPALAVGHTRLIDGLDKRLQGQRLALTGNYFSGVSIEECVSRSRLEFSRLFEPRQGKLSS